MTEGEAHLVNRSGQGSGLPRVNALTQVRQQWESCTTHFLLDPGQAHPLCRPQSPPLNIIRLGLPGPKVDLLRGAVSSGATPKTSPACCCQALSLPGWSKDC